MFLLSKFVKSSHLSLFHNLTESMHQTSPSFSLSLSLSPSNLHTPFLLSLSPTLILKTSLFLQKKISLSIPPSLSHFLFFFLSFSTNPHTHIYLFELDPQISPFLPPFLSLVHSRQILIYFPFFLSLLCTYKSTTKMDNIPCVEK